MIGYIVFGAFCAAVYIGWRFCQAADAFERCVTDAISVANEEPELDELALRRASRHG